TGIGHEADRLSGRVPAWRLHARDARTGRAHQRAGWKRRRSEVDFELRWHVQGPDPDPGSARRIEERGRDLDHGADWDRRGSADLAQSRRADAVAALCDDGVGCVGSQPPGTGDGVPDDRVWRPRAAVRDPADRPRLWGGPGRARTP